MDNSQSHNPLPLFQFSERQSELLFDLSQQLTLMLSNFRFNDPAQDHSLIRQHAAVSGQRDMLLQLLAHDTKAMNEANDRLASALGQNSPSNPSEEPEG